MIACEDATPESVCFLFAASYNDWAFLTPWSFGATFSSAAMVAESSHSCGIISSEGVPVSPSPVFVSPPVSPLSPSAGYVSPPSPSAGCVSPPVSAPPSELASKAYYSLRLMMVYAIA